VGLEKSIEEPGDRARIYHRSHDGRFFFYDFDSWARISEYEAFVRQSPCVDITTTLLKTDVVHFFFEAVFSRSYGVTFPDTVAPG